MSSLPLDPITLIVSLIAILSTVLYFHEYFLRKKNLSETRKISFETQQKSQELLEAAEIAETKLLSEKDFQSKKLVSEFKTHLENLLTTSQDTLTYSQQKLIDFMQDLQKRSLEFEESSQASTEKRIQETFERLENKLSDFLIQTEQKTTSSIELELQAVRHLIETYKDEQLKLIDENIIAMLEKTLSLVLAKKLSLKDQLDYVYEALEKAKSEKFIT